MIAGHMRKDFMAWNKDTVENKKIVDDIEEYSHGAIHLDEAELPVATGGQNQQRNYVPRKRMMNNNNGQKRKY